MLGQPSVGSQPNATMRILPRAVEEVVPGQAQLGGAGAHRAAGDAGELGGLATVGIARRRQPSRSPRPVWVGGAKAEPRDEEGVARLGSSMGG